MFDKMREKARIRRAEFASSLYDVTAERYTKIYDTEGKEAADAYAGRVQPLLDKYDKRAQR